MSEDEAAILLQAATRGMIARKAVTKMRESEQIFLGLVMSTFFLYFFITVTPECPESFILFLRQPFNLKATILLVNFQPKIFSVHFLCFCASHKLHRTGKVNYLYSHCVKNLHCS